MEELWKLLENNNFLQGGLILGFLAGIITYFKNIPFKIWVKLREQFIIYVTIRSDSDSQSFIANLFKNWLTHINLSKKVRKVEPLFYMDKNNKISFTFVIGSGEFFLFRFKRFIWISKTYEKKESSHKDNEIITVRIFSRKKEILEKIFKEIAEIENNNCFSGAQIWALGTHGWCCLPCRIERRLDSVILDKDVKEKLVDDIATFKNRKVWYKERGIPYRRGYFLYGDPGCGKTSIIIALAQYFNMPVYVVSLSSPLMTEVALSTHINETMTNAIILFEDIDSLFEERKGLLENKVTFSGLLNILDGTLSSENKIFFMTTNHKEKIDPALLRPGRVDYQQFIGKATNYQVEQMFQRFFPEQIHLSGAVIAGLVEPKTPAELQQLFMSHTAEELAISKINGHLIPKEMVTK